MLSGCVGDTGVAAGDLCSDGHAWCSPVDGSQVMHGKMASTIVGGTPCYMAPELLYKEKYDMKSDIWSMGCMVWVSAHTAPPPLTPGGEALRAAVRGGRALVGARVAAGHERWHERIRARTLTRACLGRSSRAAPSSAKVRASWELRCEPCRKRSTLNPET